MQHPETMQVIYKGSPKGGLVTINACDFDPDLHSVEAEKPAPKKRGRPKKVTEADNANC